jgi:hypothetical protein
MMRLEQIAVKPNNNFWEAYLGSDANFVSLRDDYPFYQKKNPMIRLKGIHFPTDTILFAVFL